jgi:hypothetical protein
MAHKTIFSPGKDKNQQGVGKLPQLPLGTSNFYHIYGIEEREYHRIIGRNVRLKRDEIAKIHYNEGWLGGQTPNHGFQRYYT